MRKAEIDVTKTTAKAVGYCNACTEHIGPYGGMRCTVYEIQFRGVSVRVCESCRDELMAKLKSA